MRDGPDGILIVCILGVAALLVGLVLIAATGDRDARVDAQCAAHRLSGKTYSHYVGRTVLSERMCIDSDTGQVFDPSFLKDSK